MIDFDIAVNYVIKNEGGLEESQNDPGGITKYGISLRFLKSLPDPRKYGFTAETINSDTIKALTIEKAKELYKGEFWDHAPFERINDQNNVNYIFDAAVNLGIAPAIKCAQRACWAVLKKRNIIVDDGMLGEETISTINLCALYFPAAMRSERAGEYRVIAEKNPNEKEYLSDWLDRSYTEKK